MRFRCTSDAEWHTGSTQNVSESGAIIRASTQLMPSTLVEVIITLPSSAKDAGTCLRGEGRVVRSFSLLSGHHDDVFAVAFTRVRLQRLERAPRG